MSCKSLGHNGSRAARVTTTMPHDMVVAVKETARCGGITTSAMIQRAVSHYLATVTVPRLREIHSNRSVSVKMATSLLLNLIRTGITSCSAPGRLRSQRLRCAYMRYCKSQQRLGEPKIPYAIWRENFNEISLIPNPARNPAVARNTAPSDRPTEQVIAPYFFVSLFSASLTACAL